MAGIFTFLKRSEFRLARHGKITSGKLQATERTKPIFIISVPIEGLKLMRMFPVKVRDAKATYPKTPTQT